MPQRQCIIDALLWAPPILAGLAVAVTAGRLGCTKLRRRMGLPNWTFNGSWASNITVVGALLGFSVITAVIPEKTGFLTRSQYQVFTVLFALFVALAPLAYTLTGKLVAMDNKSIGVKGWGWSFVAACFFTLWGSLGQLGIQAMVVIDISAAAALPAYTACIVDLLLAVAIVLLLHYAFCSIYLTVDMQPDPENDHAAAAAAAVHQTRWSLL